MHEKTTNRNPGQLNGTNQPSEASRDQPPSHELGAANREASRDVQRHTVQEAAEILGTTVDAVRGRIRRGTLNSMKIDGQVYVLLDAVSREEYADQSHTDDTDGRQLTADQSELVAELREQNAWLRREVERKDAILLNMTEAMKALEAPREARESDLTATESDESSAMPQNQQEPKSEPERRSWWRRLFDLPT